MRGSSCQNPPPRHQLTSSWRHLSSRLCCDANTWSIFSQSALALTASRVRALSFPPLLLLSAVAVTATRTVQTQAEYNAVLSGAATGLGVPASALTLTLANGTSPFSAPPPALLAPLPPPPKPAAHRRSALAPEGFASGASKEMDAGAGDAGGGALGSLHGRGGGRALAQASYGGFTILNITGVRALRREGIAPALLPLFASGVPLIIASLKRIFPLRPPPQSSALPRWSYPPYPPPCAPRTRPPSSCAPRSPPLASRARLSPSG